MVSLRMVTSFHSVWRIVAPVRLRDKAPTRGGQWADAFGTITPYGAQVPHTGHKYPLRGTSTP